MLYTFWRLNVHPSHQHKGTHISTRNTSGITCARSDRTLRDGSFRSALPGTPCQGYDRIVPLGRAGKYFATASSFLQLRNVSEGQYHLSLARSVWESVTKRGRPLGHGLIR